MNQQTAIGIDVGGTWTRAALVQPNGRIVSSQRHPTPGNDHGQQLVDLLAQSIRNLEHRASNHLNHVTINDPCITAQAEACGSVMSDANNTSPDPQATDTKPVQSISNTPIGIALPGPLDQQRNAILRSINLPFLQGKLIAKDLHKAIGRTPVLITDAEAATWGEYIVRDPKPQRFVHLRLGTGIACGVIIDDQLIANEHDRNQHPEVLIVDHQDSALQCHCGRCGCLETIASGFVLEQLAHENGFPDGLASLQDAWSTGDQRARSILIPVVEHISTALNNLMAQYQPDVITIGGGVVDYLPGLLAMILSNHYSSRSPLQPSKPTRLEPARLGDHSGVVGAAMLAM